MNKRQMDYLERAADKQRIELADARIAALEAALRILAASCENCGGEGFTYWYPYPAREATKKPCHLMVCVALAGASVETPPHLRGPVIQAFADTNGVPPQSETPDPSTRIGPYTGDYDDLPGDRATSETEAGYLTPPCRCGHPWHSHHMGRCIVCSCVSYQETPVQPLTSCPTSVGYDETDVTRCQNMSHKRYGMRECVECPAPKIEVKL